jgi:hypothetical protein
LRQAMRQLPQGQREAIEMLKREAHPLHSVPLLRGVSGRCR